MPLREGVNLVFRFEFFNAFNTPQFSNPGTTFGSANFGVISALSTNPRIIQLAVKTTYLFMETNDGRQLEQGYRSDTSRSEGAIPSYLAGFQRGSGLRGLCSAGCRVL